MSNMLGVPDPAIFECIGNGSMRVSRQDFFTALKDAWLLHHSVHYWTGKDRKGRPFAVAWLAGHRSGKLLCAYEFTPGGE